MPDRTSDRDHETNHSLDQKELASNLAKATAASTALLVSMATPDAFQKFETHYGDNVADSVRTFGKLAEAWFQSPTKLIEAQSELWVKQLELWQATIRLARGEEPSPVVKPKPSDRRFIHDEWRANPVFDFLKQSYLISAFWAEKLVEEAEDLDPHTRHKARFYVQQVANAFAPTNFPLTNPEVLSETLATNGRNLVQGIENLARDLEEGDGLLNVRQTDLDAFEVGKNIATTPGKVIFENELFQLIQYLPTTEKVHSAPLLLVPPWINKFYILDLTPEKSFIKWAVGQGHTVFAISWVNPDARLSQKTFEDYMRGGILTALDTVLAATKTDRANVVGYCVGGTLLAAALAYMAATGDKRISSASFLASQVDFAQAGDLKVFIDEEQLEALEQRIESEGYLSGSSMAQVFNLLRSNDLIWSYVVNNYLLGRDSFPFDLLYWNSDSTRLPAANHIFYLRECYLENKLSQGKMVLEDQRLDLSKVTIPIYSLAAREDHIAPSPSVFIGTKAFGGPVRYVMAGSGHIAGIVNPPQRSKYQFWADGNGDTIDDWINSANETPGSWWPDWNSWVKPHAGHKVKARKPATRGKFKAIEDAPGSYVRVRAG